MLSLNCLRIKLQLCWRSCFRVFEPRRSRGSCNLRLPNIRVKHGIVFLISIFILSKCFFTTNVSTDHRRSLRFLNDVQVNINELLDSSSSFQMLNDTAYFLSGSIGELKAWIATRQTVISRTGINCAAMFRNDVDEIRRAEKYMNVNRPEVWTMDDYIHITRNCSDFRHKRGYMPKPESKKEAEFPIAFSILMYKDSQQVERLLRAIYAPQNYYCIHIDAKAAKEDHEAMSAIANCFPNVFLASKMFDVHWGHISIMHAEMICLQKLLNFKWKYFINLSGQMFPAHSNAELVEILKLYNGSNDVEGSHTKAVRFQNRYLLRWEYWHFFNANMPTSAFKGRPPHNVSIHKGSNQVAISRAFAIYFLYSKVSQDIISWFSDVYAPDEFIWPTLNHNPHLLAPGTYKGDPETKAFTARASIWRKNSLQVEWSWKNWNCQGQWIHRICIFGVGDLPWLYQRPELFVNKFHSDFHWLAYDCMEELIFNRTMENAKAAASNIPPKFNLTYHSNLSIVKNKYLVVSNKNFFQQFSGIEARSNAN